MSLGSGELELALGAERVGEEPLRVRELVFPFCDCCEEARLRVLCRAEDPLVSKLMRACCPLAELIRPAALLTRDVP